MRKEVLIAIIIGFALGLVITFGIWTANKALKTPTTDESPPTTEEETTPTPAPMEFTLSIDSPENNSISTDETIAVEGQTSPSAVIVILYEGGEKILEADNEGKFSTEIELNGGENEITISGYDQEGNEVKQTLVVVYSTAEI